MTSAYKPAISARSPPPKAKDRHSQPAARKHTREDPSFRNETSLGMEPCLRSVSPDAAPDFVHAPHTAAGESDGQTRTSEEMRNKHRRARLRSLRKGRADRSLGVHILEFRQS